MTSPSLSSSTIRPQVELACRRCRAAGRRVSRVVAAIDALAVDVAGMHRVAGVDGSGCTIDDLDVVGSAPYVDGVPGPAAAVSWARAVDEVEPHLRDAYVAWGASGVHVVDAEDVPETGEFYDRYQGLWPSVDGWLAAQADYAVELDPAADTGESWERDMLDGVSVIDAPRGGGVLIFRQP